MAEGVRATPLRRKMREGGGCIWPDRGFMNQPARRRYSLLATFSVDPVPLAVLDRLPRRKAGSSGRKRKTARWVSQRVRDNEKSD